MQADELTNKLGGKDGLYAYFEDKKVIMPKKDSIKLTTLARWFLKVPEILNFRNFFKNDEVVCYFCKKN